MKKLAVVAPRLAISAVAEIFHSLLSLWLKNWLLIYLVLYWLLII